MNAVFALRLRQLREERELTQADLGRVLKLSASSVGMYEQGRRDPDLNTLQSMAAFFEVSIDYLLGRSSVLSVKEQPATMDLGFNLRDAERLTPADRKFISDYIKLRTAELTEERGKDK